MAENGRSIENLVGVNRKISNGTSSPPVSYISEAFSFLQDDQYNAYRHYEVPGTTRKAPEGSADPEPAKTVMDSAKPPPDVHPGGVSNPGYMDHGDLDNHRSGTLGAASVATTNKDLFDTPYLPRSVSDVIVNEKPESENTFNVKCFIVVIVIAMLVIVCAGVVCVYFLVIKPQSSEGDTTELRGYIRINETWNDSLSDTQGATYKQYSEEVTQAISYSLDRTKYKDKYTMEIIEIRKGSIFVIFELIIKALTVENAVLTSLVEGFRELEEQGILPWPLDIEEDIHLEEITTSTITRSTTTTPTTTTPESTSTTPATTTTSSEPVWTDEMKDRTTPAPVICEDLDYEKCKPYHHSNHTGFPNVFGSSNQNSAAPLMTDFEKFALTRCHPHTLLFACHAVFPDCVEGILKFPCRSFCESYRMSCHYPMECHLFPDDDDQNVCVTMPTTGTSSTTTATPSSCTLDELRCWDGTCVDAVSRCDGQPDCPDDSDEKGCNQQFHLNCDFENQDTCMYDQNIAGDFEWTLHLGGSQSALTGPVFDHTKFNAEGSYLLAEASGQYAWSRAVLTSIRANYENPHCLSWFYYMWGEDVDSLKVYLRHGDDDDVLAWYRSSSQGQMWKMGSVTVPAGELHVVFEATRGLTYKSDIAIDDITDELGTCDPDACGEDEFTCGNGNCVLQASVCDRNNDCGNYKDEVDCECTRDEWQCGMGLCVPRHYFCDNYPDCPDRSDENQCADKCSIGRYRCTDGRCIMHEWVCDGVDDCQDGGDETNCNTCTEEEFQCGDLTCISKDDMCDTINDCLDASDESNCYTCTEEEFQCGDLSCISKEDMCDTKNDCLDASDESNCFMIHETLYVVNVLHEGSWRPLCAHGLSEANGDEICQELGYKKMSQMFNVTVQERLFMVYEENPDNQGKGILSRLVLKVAVECPKEAAIDIVCEDNECGYRDEVPSSFIINGETSLPGEWPWHVGIYAGNVYICGGTLVSHIHVITAAHCARSAAGDPYEVSTFEIRLGTTKRTTHDSNRVKRDVLRIEEHADFQGWHVYWGGDMAVFTMNKAVSFSQFIRPACLPIPNDLFTSSSICYTAGWGRTNGYDTNSYPEDLKHARLRIWSDEQCRDVYPYLVDVNVCAGYASNQLATCVGDSGGGLVCLDPQGTWKLAAVFSFVVRGCNKTGYPPVFTNAIPYLDWMEDSIGSDSCVFKCTNSNCLYDLTSLCDGEDDCGDFSDEILPCEPSVSCDFEDSYKCGYTHVRNNNYHKWSHQSGHFAINVGPITDYTTKEEKGHVMYTTVSSGDASFLLSPVLTADSDSCVHFNYIIRGGSRAGMAIYHIPFDSAHQSYPEGVNIDDKLEDLYLSGGSEDRWYREMADIPHGTHVIGFEAFDEQGSGTIHLAIDNVELKPGACDFDSCPENEHICQEGIQCYREDESCNYHPRCDDGTDEQNCLDSLYYNCGFQKYANCRLQQQDQNDQLDWSIVTSSDISESEGGNGPLSDATTDTTDGYMGYINTIGQAAGTKANLQLELGPKTGLVGESCLYFDYNMVSKGALQVEYVYASDRETIWRALGENQPSWRPIQLRLPKTVVVLIFTGLAAPESIGYPPRGYIALDDIMIAHKQCSSPACTTDEFECDDGRCVSITTQCDGTNDCPGGEDENPTICGCPATGITCDSGRCINRLFTCDGIPHCEDSEDESPELCVCTPDMFECDSGECVRGDGRCDGFDNCKDGSDELACTECASNEYSCTDDVCKNAYTWCNGREDCSDGEDEGNTCSCLSYQFTCANGQCIPGFHYCDQYKDCSDGSDEPAECKCNPEWHFNCNNKQCIYKGLKCDGKPHCADGSDEGAFLCAEGNFQCDDLSWIREDKYCDGVPHCANGEDEAIDCECAENSLRCASGGCYKETQRCDVIRHCDDESDEIGCDCDKDTEKRCDNGKCVPNYRWCNGHHDCGDYSDENHCDAYCENKFKCQNGMCISQIFLCDGDDNCGDLSDENNCSCASGFFKCHTSKECILDVWTCDGYRDCEDASDEDGCEKCSNNEFMCGDLSCISLSKVCDMKSDCSDDTDEQICLKVSDDTGGLMMRRSGQWYPTCAESWQASWGETICTTLGHDPAFVKETVQVGIEEFLKTTSTSSAFNISHFTISSQCTDNRALKLICGDSRCGRSNQVLPTDPAAFIIGGELASQGDWPWMGGLYYLGEFRCGVTLIDVSWAITAAHCFYGITDHQTEVPLSTVPHYFFIQLGSTKVFDLTSPSGVKASLKKIMIHEEYQAKHNSYLHYDVALIQLVEEVTVSDDIKPACLQEPMETLPLTSYCYTTGWGFTNIHDATETPDLREAKMRLWSHEDCSSSEVWGENIQEDIQLCAGYESGLISTCNGDSGGPLVCADHTGRWLLAGTTSFGQSGCGQSRSSDTPIKPNVFTKTSFFIDWIQNTMTMMTQES